jgi:hypothetical protein
VADISSVLNTTLAVALGGTGGASASAARTALGLVKQTGVGDDTAGSLALVGTFGWGGFAIDVPSTNLNNIQRSGVYSLGSGDSNNPLGTAGLCINIERTTDRQVQMAFSCTTTEQQGLYWRQKSGDGWSDWRAIGHNGQTAGAIGAYAMCKNVSGGAIGTDSSIVAASNLRFSDTALTVGGVPNGTWKCMSNTASNAVGLFMRTA